MEFWEKNYLLVGWSSLFGEKDWAGDTLIKPFGYKVIKDWTRLVVYQQKI